MEAFFNKEHVSLAFSDLCWTIHKAYDLNYTIYKRKRILVCKPPPTNFHKNYYHHLSCIFIALFSKGILEILEICKIIWLHEKDTSCAILKGIYSSQSGQAALDILQSKTLQWSHLHNYIIIAKHAWPFWDCFLF